MKKAIACIFVGFFPQALMAQECAERFFPFDVTTSQQSQALKPDDEVWIEYSTDCFHIPTTFWEFDESLQSQWGGQEDYDNDVLSASGMWIDIARDPADALTTSVLGDDGNPLEFDSVLVDLGNGRVRSVVTIPSLIGRSTLGGGPVVEGDQLVANWSLDLGMPLGNALQAILPEQALTTISFSTTVPEPSSFTVWQLFIITLIWHRVRKSRS